MAEWPDLRYQIVAILRGVKPDEVEAIAEALIEEGVEAIEVPLNSPEPFESIRRLAARFGDRALIGGGTMLTIADIENVHAVGGRLMVSPNAVPDVIRRAAELGMVTMPGVLTPAEAFAALAAGASALKFFPAGVLGPAGIAAIKAVLPNSAVVGAVGGVGPDNMAEYMNAGVKAFGLGTALYQPGDKADAVRARVRPAVKAYREAAGQGKARLAGFSARAL